MAEQVKAEEFLTQRRCQDVLAKWQCELPDGHKGRHEAKPTRGSSIKWEETG